MCGIAGIVRPDAVGARRRADAPADGEGDPPPRARTASGSRSTPAPGSSPRGSRSSTCPAAGSRSRRLPRAASSSTTARSTTTRSCAPSSPRAARRSRPRATPRSCCGCWSGTASRRWTGSTASSRSRGGSRPDGALTLVRDRFGVRPLYYTLLDDGTLVFGSEAKALFASGEVDRRARSGRHRRGLHALGAAGAAHGVPRRPSGPARRAGRLGARQDRRRADVVDARVRPRRRPRRRSRGAPPRQRPAAPACGRPGRHVSLGRARLEPDHRARPGRDGPPAAHVLDRVQGPALRRARPPGGGGARHRHAPPRRRGGAARDRRRRSPTSSGTPRCRWCAPRRCRSSCSRARCASAAITVVATGEGADELFLGLRAVQGGRAARAAPARPGACDRAARSALRLSRACRGAPRPGLAALPARDRGRRRAARLASHPRGGDGDGEGVLPTRGRRRGRERAPALDRLRAELPAAFAELEPRSSARRGSS